MGPPPKAGVSFLWDTVIVCSLTSNLKRAKSPGNIMLVPGEAGLSKQSVINISQIYTVDKGELGNKIGTLGPERILEVLDGIKLILMPKDIGPGIDAAIEREDERY